MPSLTIGDLAQSFMLQRRGASLKTEMSRLTEELSTGRVSDVKSVLAGNFSYLTDIERDMKALDSYKVSTTEATQFTGAVENALERVQSITGTLANTLILAGGSSVSSVVDQASNDARADLDALVSTLNADLAGRNLFSGAATNTTPLISDADILDAVRTVVTGQASADSARAAAQVFFNDPAGFEALAYLGSDTALAPFQLSKDTDLALDIRAIDPALKDALMNTALAALADDAAMTLDPDEKKKLMLGAGERLLNAQDQIIALRADVGFAQARIEDMAARNAVERTGLEYAKGALLEADPYETATRLEDVQFQLQSLYSVTVRLSELSLVNFIR